MNPESIVRDTGRPVSLEDFLDHFEAMVAERRELASRLADAVEESNALQSEIRSLRAQLGSHLDSLLPTKERLMREEFERKYQDLVVEVRRERGKFNELIGDLRKRLSGCICHRTSNHPPFWNSVAQRSMK